MYSDAEIFCGDFEDLQNWHDNPTERNLLKSSSALRRIFLEDLMHKVNRSLKHEVLFQALDVKKSREESPSLLPGVFYSFQKTALEPTEFPNLPVRMMTLDEWLANPVVHMGATTLSVLELIKYLANSQGGVHKNDKDKAARPEVSDMSQKIRVFGVPAAMAHMPDLLEVALRALRPIYEQLKPGKP